MTNFGRSGSPRYRKSVRINSEILESTRRITSAFWQDPSTPNVLKGNVERKLYYHDLPSLLSLSKPQISKLRDSPPVRLQLGSYETKVFVF
jgi:hypothetical protein